MRSIFFGIVVVVVVLERLGVRVAHLFHSPPHVAVLMVMVSSKAMAEDVVLAL